MMGADAVIDLRWQRPADRQRGLRQTTPRHPPPRQLPLQRRSAAPAGGAALRGAPQLPRDTW